MKTNKKINLLVIIISFLIIPSHLYARLNMTVNSLADDEYAYA